MIEDSIAVYSIDESKGVPQEIKGSSTLAKLKDEMFKRIGI